MKRYNKLKKTFTKLEEGEKFCGTCHGEGMVKPKRSYAGDIKKGSLLVCKDCLGRGKLDWVEEVVGPNIGLNPCLDIKIETKNVVVRPHRRLEGSWTYET